MDYIVALGSGLIILKDKTLELSPEAKITTIAAGVLYKEKQGRKIIFSGGHTKGKDKASEAGKMLELFKIKFPDVPAEDIILEQNSLDTAGNASEVGKILPQDSKVILLSFSYHLLRAGKIFKNFGINPETIYASDKVLKKLFPLYDEFLNKFNLRKKTQKIIRELICAPLVYTIDPKGKILRVITSRTRGGSLSFLPF